MLNVVYYVAIGLVFGLGWLVSCNMQLKKAKAKDIDYLSLPKARRNRMLTVIIWVAVWPLIIVFFVITSPFLVFWYLRDRKIIKEVLSNREEAEAMTREIIKSGTFN
jgi:heme/copper-type cytochrome/quinol oxidase subunit 2